MPNPAPGAAAPLPPPAAATVEASVDLPIGGRPFRARLSVPASACRPTQLLPLFHALADAFVQGAVEQAAAGGQAVSCAAGCAACCRHLVPVSEVEGRRLRACLDAMVPADQAAVRGRLQAAQAALDDSGLRPRLDRLDALWDDDLVGLVRDYFRQGIDCPFLQPDPGGGPHGGRCRVYADRPAACREHLVTSPAEHCADPAEAGVALLPIPKEAVSRALRCFNTSPAFGHKGWRPMVLALGWALDEATPAEAEAGTGPALLTRFFERLTGDTVRAHGA